MEAVHLRIRICAAIVAGLSALPASFSQGLLWDTFFKAGQKAFSEKQYVEAERQFRSASAATKTFEKKDDPRVQKTMRFLTRVLQAEGKYSEAEKLLKELLEKDSESFGNRSSEVALDLDSLGLLYRQQNRTREPEENFLQALESLEKNKKTEPLDTVSTVSHLAALNQDLGKYAEAETWLSKALAITAAPGGEHFKTGKNYLTIAGKLITTGPNHNCSYGEDHYTFEDVKVSDAAFNATLSWIGKHITK